MISKPVTPLEESVEAPEDLKLWEVSADRDFALALHGGAGGRIAELADGRRRDFEAGLSRAYRAGEEILRSGGSALDAVCAAVEVMEDDPLFNAGRGAALTADGEAELDAAVMTGDGHAGAIAASRYARNPVRLARAVMERSEHLLLVAPPAELVAGWDLSVVTPEYFVTEARRQQLVRLQDRLVTGPRHGTVGAVARDTGGRIAAATSTGGMSNQSAGRVGDTPIIGAGTYARDGLAAISCTGHGEAFIRGVVAYDIAARIRYLGSGPAEAVTATFQNELSGRDSSGGLVCVDASGRIVVAHNSPSMFAAYPNKGKLIIHT
ncbi:isoaspartyl peptidase/L-asparaginase family protein [Microlunatus sp. Gsoil 973]|uniref:isoaspartyl peptidase/L-asparaginase family protein n=1 Tax=Microlunatus sp. Gsoil 973 TaxID=2672569 RepID=UPI0012B501B9|nr:isoaspartyl peptidase/L-asparaginase [Microlunatus sp. Gsoil 973]QGN32997.1 isoaspartyl dipeptidase with L-asparaginase activity [Microlunatus sp. Gsoil 973]